MSLFVDRIMNAVNKGVEQLTMKAEYPAETVDEKQEGTIFDGKETTTES